MRKRLVAAAAASAPAACWRDALRCSRRVHARLINLLFIVTRKQARHTRDFDTLGAQILTNSARCENRTRIRMRVRASRASRAIISPMRGNIIRAQQSRRQRRRVNVAAL